MRRPVQIEVSPNSRGIYALCDDGAIFIGRWREEPNDKARMVWERLPSLPQDENLTSPGAVG